MANIFCQTKQIRGIREIEGILGKPESSCEKLLPYTMHTPDSARMVLVRYDRRLQMPMARMVHHVPVLVVPVVIVD